MGPNDSNCSPSLGTGARALTEPLEGNLPATPHSSLTNAIDDLLVKVLQLRQTGPGCEKLYVTCPLSIHELVPK